MSEGLIEPALPVDDDRETSLAVDDKPEVRLWLRLLACSTLIEKRLRTRLREAFATTLPRFDALAQLYRAPEGLTMGALSDRLMVSAGNITGLIDRLAQEGLVVRAPGPRDRRTQRVRLTAAGRRAFASMTPVHHAWVEEAMAGLDRQEIHQLIGLLGRLKATLKDQADS